MNEERIPLAGTKATTFAKYAINFCTFSLGKYAILEENWVEKYAKRKERVLTRSDFVHPWTSQE